MAKTPKESLIWKLQIVQSQLPRPLPTKTKQNREREKSARLTHVGLFNQYLDEAKALGLAVPDADWPQPFQNTGFGGVDQFICTWGDVAHRNRQLLTLLEKAPDPAKPVSASGTDPAPAQTASPDPATRS